MSEEERDFSEIRKIGRQFLVQNGPLIAGIAILLFFLIWFLN